MRKINLGDEGEVRAKVLSASRKVAELVGKTLGPDGQSIIIDRGGPEPLIVDDGRRAAENIKLDDPIEQMAARVIYAVTRKTDERTGDGTTTSMVLTTAIVEEVANKHITFGGMVGTRRSVADVDRELHASKDQVVAQLRKMAKPVKTEAELMNVASIVSGDTELGKVIGGMYHKLGPDGHITMEFNLLSEQMETEIVPGYRFSGGYAADWMVTDSVHKTASMDDTNVLVTNRKDLDKSLVEAIMQKVAANGKNRLVVIAPRFTPSFLRAVYATYTKSKFAVLCVRAPSRGEEAFKDIAVFVGAKYIGENDDMGQALQLTDLGYASKVDVTDDTTVIVEGAGKKEDIAKRIEEVKGEEANQKFPQFKKDRQERISALAGGVGLIRIGAPTDEERNWLKYKIEDAVRATKVAYRSGIVPGGGQAFIKIANTMPADDILCNALYAPYETLKRNAGGKFTVPKHVFDPVEVEIAALENAVSAASKLIRIGGAIAYLPTPTLDEAMRNVGGDNNGPRIEEDED